MSVKSIIILVLMSASTFCQDITHIYVDKINALKATLEADDTDKIEYTNDFMCHQFSKRLYLQNSTLVQDLSHYNITDLESQWGIKVNRVSEPSIKIHYVALASRNAGFYHAINAVLLDESAPDKLESYVFIEPQSDKLLLAKDLHSEYRINSDIEVRIGTFDSFKFNGNIWQSFSSTNVKEVVSKKLIQSKTEANVNSNHRNIEKALKITTQNKPQSSEVVRY